MKTTDAFILVVFPRDYTVEPIYNGVEYNDALLIMSLKAVIMPMNHHWIKFGFTNGSFDAIISVFSVFSRQITSTTQGFDFHKTNRVFFVVILDICIVDGFSDNGRVLEEE